MNILDDKYKQQLEEVMNVIDNKTVYNSINEIMDSFNKNQISLQEYSQNLSTVTSILENIKIPKIKIDDSIIEYFTSVNSIITDLSKYYKSSNLFINIINNIKYISDGKTNIRSSQATDALILKRMFPEITLSECEDFINYVSQYPMLSFKNDIGKKIYEFIEKVDFVEIYNIKVFRVRKHEYGRKAMYTEDEMFLAPYKLTQQSRFSSTGQNYLYTSEKLNIAKEEVNMKKEDLYTWIHLEIKNPFRILDIRNNNIPIFEYCHLKSEDKNSKINTEYLLPNYIADCAKQIGFEGVQYYSIIDNITNNYVFFKPGIRDFIVINRGKDTI